MHGGRELVYEPPEPIEAEWNGNDRAQREHTAPAHAAPTHPVPALSGPTHASAAQRNRRQPGSEPHSPSKRKRSQAKSETRQRRDAKTKVSTTDRR
jgi:hypothetical protein